MSLYNHVSNKADILDGLAERVFSQVEPPDPALPWPERIRAAALSMHRALSRHPVVPLALVTDQSNPTSPRALEPLDAMVGALYDAGLDDAQVWRTLRAVNSLVFGSLLLTTGGFSPDPRTQAGGQELDLYIREVNPTRLPHFSRLLRHVPELDPAGDFEQSLDILIQGLIQWNKSFRSDKMEASEDERKGTS
jgi:hypothetical protein